MKNTTISVTDVQKKDNPLIDSLIAFKILTLLSTPFEEMDAYKLGIINKQGDVLRPYSTLSTYKDRLAANYLMRLVITIKRLMLKTSNDWYLRDMARALFLIKESYYSGIDDDDICDKFLLENYTDEIMELKIKEFMDAGIRCV